MIRIPNPEKLDSHLVKPFSAVQWGRRPSKHRFRVERRASSFPVCPRKYHIYRRLPPHKRPFEDETFIRDSTTLEGTGLHLALQRWFGISVPDSTYGNWVCHSCRKIKRHRLGTQYCNRCGNEMLYEEYSIKAGKGVPFSGHIDLVLRIPSLDVLVDFKGSNSEKMYEIANRGCKYEHYLQTNAYANAINLGGQDVGDLEYIDKIVIIYVDRGMPWKKWLPIQMPVSKRVYRETVALIKKAKHSLKKLEIPRGICSHPGDDRAKWCEVQSLCFSPLLETKLEDTIYPEDDRPQDKTLEKRLYSESKKGKNHA